MTLVLGFIQTPVFQVHPVICVTAESSIDSPIMRTPESNASQDAVEKIGIGGVERQITSEETQKGEVLEDDGEVFKSHTGQAEFRALGW